MRRDAGIGNPRVHFQGGRGSPWLERFEDRAHHGLRKIAGQTLDSIRTLTKKRRRFHTATGDLILVAKDESRILPQHLVGGQISELDTRDQLKDIPRDLLISGESWRAGC